MGSSVFSKLVFIVERTKFYLHRCHLQMGNDAILRLYKN